MLEASDMAGCYKHSGLASFKLDDCARHKLALDDGTREAFQSNVIVPLQEAEERDSGRQKDKLLEHFNDIIYEGKFHEDLGTMLTTEISSISSSFFLIITSAPVTATLQLPENKIFGPLKVDSNNASEL